MKRLTVLLLASALIFSLTACSISEPPDNNEQKEMASSTESISKDPAPALDENAEIETPEPIEVELSFTEVVVVDNDECTIKITEIDPTSIWGFTLKVFLENKSADKSYMFSLQNSSINGVETVPFFAEEVAAGKKSNTEINFLDSFLSENDIGDFTDIELSFRVYDSNDWSADPVAEEAVHVYPYGEDKVIQFVRKPNPDDQVILDNEHATVIITDYKEDDIFGYGINLFLLNKSNFNIMFSVDEASINGFMLDPFYASSVSAGKCTFSTIYWSDTAFEENGITEVEEIEFTLRAYDEADWTAEEYANELITLNP